MKCSFCGKQIERGTGKIVVAKDGTAKHLCSMKCEKNSMKMGRISAKTKWTNDYHRAKVTRIKTAKKQAK